MTQITRIRTFFSTSFPIRVIRVIRGCRMRARRAQDTDEDSNDLAGKRRGFLRRDRAMVRGLPTSMTRWQAARIPAKHPSMPASQPTPA
jgi:hypothetical protein